MKHRLKPYRKRNPFGGQKTLPVTGGHILSYKEYGNRQGVPIVYQHGGPGGGTPPDIHRFFDPAVFHVITYDQRGSGDSTPVAELKDNSPEHLVEDIERLRTHLDIDQWHVMGGSWGSTLALLYAVEYPERVQTILLRGIWMQRQNEIDWFLNGMGKFYPAAQRAFEEFIPEQERGNLLSAYYNRLCNPDSVIHMAAAHEWCKHEDRAAHLTPPKESELKYKDNEALACARIEAHFFMYHTLTDDRILGHIDRIRHIPTMIVQGLHDVICPPETAWDLKQAFPESHLQMTCAGHARKDPENTQALLAAIERIKTTGSPLPPAQSSTPPVPGIE